MSKKHSAIPPYLTGIEYQLSFILDNPIPAECVRCGYQWVDSDKYKDAIRAPSLDNCACFFCWSGLRPLDEAAYEERLATLHLYRETVATDLDSEEE